MLWTNGPDGNIQHIREHGITPAEVRQVLMNPLAVGRSRTTGRPIAFGYTRRKRKIAVVYEMLDEVTAYPITAYDVED